MYCPWVDQLFAGNTKAEKIRSGYGWVELMNPCDPADYQYFGRPMAFSKAESVIRGYEDYDLSSVEIKIQKILKDSYYDLLELINYKDLTSIEPTDDSSFAAQEGWKGNEILISAAAMIATFHFNQEFSDNGFMSTDITLYPQSYELKNMNFDAYLRIIMGNSIIHETSIWSALVLLVEDLLAVFVVPILKILLITVIFTLALALAVSCIINKPENMIKIFLKTYLLPLFAMMAIFIAHTIVISWFIGEGSSAGLIDTHSIAVTTGDPTLTLLLMIVTDLCTSILMWKLLKFAAKSTVKYIQDIMTGIAALGKGTFDGVAKVIAGVAGVGTLAVGAASLAGKAAVGTGKAAATVGKGAASIAGAPGRAIRNSKEKKEAEEKEKRAQFRDNVLQRLADQASIGGGVGAGGSGNGSGNGNGNGNSSNDLAADVKAIRSKLEGINPKNMTNRGSESNSNNGGSKTVQSQSAGASSAKAKTSEKAKAAQGKYESIKTPTKKEYAAGAMQEANSGINAGLKQAQANLAKLEAEQKALVVKYGAQWNRQKKKFTSTSRTGNVSEQNRQLNDIQKRINASRTVVEQLKMQQAPKQGTSKTINKPAVGKSKPTTTTTSGRGNASKTKIVKK